MIGIRTTILVGVAAAAVIAVMALFIQYQSAVIDDQARELALADQVAGSLATHIERTGDVNAAFDQILDSTPQAGGEVDPIIADALRSVFNLRSVQGSPPESD